MRIAFIEDDADWSSAICEILTYEGHSVEPYFNTSVSTVELNNFDMVICDNKIEAPNSGIKFITKLRVSGFTGIMVLYTSYPRNSLEDLCERVDAYLVCKVDDISHAISKVTIAESVLRSEKSNFEP